VCDYNVTIDKVGKSKHNKTLLRYKESKDSINYIWKTEIRVHSNPKLNYLNN